MTNAVRPSEPAAPGRTLIPAPARANPATTAVAAVSGGIKLRSVRKSYGSTLAADLPALDIPAGSFTVLVGPSGCGKSTLLRMIAGLETPEAGQIHIDGRDVTTAGPGERGVAIVFQDFALYPHMTVARNVGFGLTLEAKHDRRNGLSRAEIQRRVGDMCDLLGLGDKLARKPRELSGGERQRVALARALVRRKPVLLLDEPLSNLDAGRRAPARAELIRLHREVAGTFVLVTHDQAEALSLGTRVVVLNAGRLEQVGTPEEIWRRPANLFVARFLGSPAMNILPVSREADSGDQRRLQGWRPADAVAVDAAGPLPARDDPGQVFEGVVDVAEFVGDRRVAHCVNDHGTWSVEFPAATPVTVGQRLRVLVPAESLHQFDAQTGVRL
ncbi:ABC transporter ATP-binding protein [Frankia sp. AgB32]|uniref:ABC transporter ATP-binding protein n=1 Tax=Frankia sp. AgB32 TaxID=631119 RepID=UPI00200C440E|nr:ABC transporter ATP-binding protein [Frankia sp. AgB32]MCK9897346.1 ABC transporter ATP-binding protein [Frankia sp. AgB32]